MSARATGVSSMLFQIRAARLPAPVLEYRFAAIHVGMGKGLRKRLIEAGMRDWRFDMAWPAINLALEYEGATPAGGRHQRFKGFLGGIRKYDAAQSLGWTIYRTTFELVRSGRALATLESLMRAKSTEAFYSLAGDRK